MRLCCTSIPLYDSTTAISLKGIQRWISSFIFFFFQIVEKFQSIVWQKDVYIYMHAFSSVFFYIFKFTHLSFCLIVLFWFIYYISNISIFICRQQSIRIDNASSFISDGAVAMAGSAMIGKFCKSRDEIQQEVDAIVWSDCAHWHAWKFIYLHYSK